ncbi:MAG: hypothetical protein WC889_12300, partial [Myxococcota bacterium]
MKSKRLYAAVVAVSALGVSIPAYGTVEVLPLEIKAEGKAVKEFILKNKGGMKAVISNYGGVLMELDVP